jgi:hypothetical protein
LVFEFIFKNNIQNFEKIYNEEEVNSFLYYFIQEFKSKSLEQKIDFMSYLDLELACYYLFENYEEVYNRMQNILSLTDGEKEEFKNLKDKELIQDFKTTIEDIKNDFDMINMSTIYNYNSIH